MMVIQIRNWRKALLIACMGLLALLALTLGGGNDETASGARTAGAIDFPVAEAAAIPTVAETSAVFTDFGFSDDDPGRFKAERANREAELLSEYRLQRERLQGERTLLLQKIIADEQSSAESREAAELQLLAQSRQTEKELKAETLLKSQGAEDCAVILESGQATALVSAAVDAGVARALVAQTVGVEEARVNILVITP